jgi:hypothetical protein
MSNNANTIKIETLDLTEPFHNSLSDYTTVSINSMDTLSITTGSSGSNVLGAVGSAGSYNWTTNGTNGVDWGSFTVGSSINSTIGQSGLMELHGKDADIKVNGRSLMDAIDALEQRLNILVPNPELESEWDELRELGERYRELERQCKEKGDMWAKLKEIKK